MQNATADASQSASSKPPRKPASSKTPDGNPSGAALPVAGNHSPPQQPALPQADIQAAMAQHGAAAAAVATAAAKAGSAGVEGAGVENDGNTGAAAITGLTADAKQPSGAPAAVSEGSAAPAPPAAAGAVVGADAASDPHAVPSGAAAGQPAAAQATADSGKSTAVTAMAAASPGPMAKFAVRNAPSSTRPGATAGGTGAAGAAAAGVEGERDAAGPGTTMTGFGQVAAATDSGVPRDAASTIAASAAAAQAANPAGTGTGAADDAAADGLGGTGAAAAPAPSAAIGMAAARAATSAASVQNAAAAGTAGDKHGGAGGAADGVSAAGSGGDALAGMFQLNPTDAASSSAATSPTPTFALHAGVDSADFAQGLSEHVTYMVDAGLNGAKLQVNPPQLGPIELRIAVSGDHAQVWMTTHSAVTRDALESSSPKLREMLGAQGFGAVSVNISQRSFQERSGQSQPYERMASSERSATAPVAAASNGSRVSRGPAGGLDAYA